MKYILCLDRTILLLIGNQYYCLYRTIFWNQYYYLKFLQLPIIACIGQYYCLIHPTLLPNLEPSYCLIKSATERSSLLFNFSNKKSSCKRLHLQKILVKATGQVK